tara:strand:+ start:731 stop:910 length:180 start_codon:yes stop_codon:yes gene_type:complete
MLAKVAEAVPEAGHAFILKFSAFDGEVKATKLESPKLVMELVFMIVLKRDLNDIREKLN